MKRQMEEDEAFRQAALDVAIRAGVLEVCGSHEECIFRGHRDIEEAYKLANSEITMEGGGVAPSDRRKMTDEIKKVVEDYCSAEECPRCVKNRDED